MHFGNVILHPFFFEITEWVKEEKKNPVVFVVFLCAYIKYWIVKKKNDQGKIEIHQDGSDCGKNGLLHV